jgi:hypothetical protein
LSNIKFWRYSLPPTDDNIEGWGIFLMDSTGMFAAYTDYGNYCFKWTHHGCKDFREFIVKAYKSYDYILGKLTSKVYSGKKTVKGIKEHILEYRRNNWFDKKFARQEWDLINETEDMDSEHGFNEWYENTALDDASEFYATDWTPQAKAFAKKLMPRLAEVLRQELIKEAA